MHFVLLTKPRWKQSCNTFNNFVSSYESFLRRINWCLHWFSLVPTPEKPVRQPSWSYPCWANIQVNEIQGEWDTTRDHMIIKPGFTITWFTSVLVVAVRICRIATHHPFPSLILTLQPKQEHNCLVKAKLTICTWTYPTYRYEVLSNWWAHLHTI